LLQHQTCPRNAFNLVAILGLLSLTGCGSTSGLQNAQGQALASTRKFSKVTVQNFKLSLALGGGVAAARNPTMFMNGAAEKIAEEAAKVAR
jgi:hypothetical protein